MSFFVILRGPLGSGKTTIAHALAVAQAADIISIDGLVEAEWDGGSEELFLRASNVAAELARAALGRGRPVIFDGNFYWKSAIDRLVEKLPYPHAIFTLEVPLKACIERDRHRSLSHGEEATREVFEKVTRVTAGLPIDGTQEMHEIVRAIVSRLPPHGER